MSDIFEDPTDHDQSAEERAEKRAKHKLELLRHWLARPYWSLIEACHVLSGVDPETRISEAIFPNGEVRLRLLPGRDAPRLPYEWHDLATEIEEATTLIRERLESLGDVAAMAPSDIIKICVASKIIPPWYSIAAKDPKCTRLLHKGTKNPIGSNPPPVLDRDVSASEVAKSISDVSRLGGKARWEKLHAKMVEAVNRSLEKAGNAGFPREWHFKTKSDVPCPRKIANSLLNIEEFPLNPKGEAYGVEAVEKHVKGWLAKFQKNEPAAKKINVPAGR
ncbi:hypothetical protein ACD589_00525 [Rhizobium sp. 814_E9_N1_1]|uniref:hypothetical protein n=1 Tax=unclassified Rhizobium TaxID=2613769 RepID=UPI003F2644E6